MSSFVILIDGRTYYETQLQCPDCSGILRLRKDSYGVRYKCVPPCRGSHGAHPDGTPLGVPASWVTKQARIRAHEVFDRIWKTGTLSRTDAYTWMAGVLSLPKEDAHIGSMNEQQCEKLITFVQEFYPDLFPLSLD